MVTISGGSPLGTSIDATELESGSVTYVKLGTDLFKAELLETLTYSGDATQTSGTLDAYDHYLVVVKDLAYSGAGLAGLQMRIDGDSGNNYSQMYAAAAGITENTGIGYMDVAHIINTVNTNIMILIGGKGAANTPFYRSVSVMGYAMAGGNRYLGGTHKSGGASDQLTTLRFSVLANTLTGTIDIYGLN